MTISDHWQPVRISRHKNSDRQAFHNFWLILAISWYFTNSPVTMWLVSIMKLCLTTCITTNCAWDVYWKCSEMTTRKTHSLCSWICDVIQKSRWFVSEQNSDLQRNVDWRMSPEDKQQSMRWLHPESPGSKNFKQMLLNCKTMRTTSFAGGVHATRHYHYCHIILPNNCKIWGTWLKNKWHSVLSVRVVFHYKARLHRVIQMWM